MRQSWMWLCVYVGHFLFISLARCLSCVHTPTLVFWLSLFKKEEITKSFGHIVTALARARPEKRLGWAGLGLVPVVRFNFRRHQFNRERGT
ncbi:hypothetical protein GE21DRAFT_1281574 [Neurospora crassa]|nr:hypothetical protein GE21DRAFT_1281574 [Neurospora crassa]